MSDDTLINTEYSFELKYVGQEKTPVIIIDNFLQSIERIAQAAMDCKSDFKGDPTSYYPGIRHALPRWYVEPIIRHLHDSIKEQYSIPKEATLSPQSFCFSLMAIAEPDLHPFQCIPHFDSTRPYFLALLHYLNPGPFSGTVFFRHNPTGYETITEQRKKHYFSTADAFINSHEGLPKQQYYCGEDGHYSIIETIEYKQNRLLIYPGNLLHGPAPGSDKSIDPDPASGRLTGNFFIDFA